MVIFLFNLYIFGMQRYIQNCVIKNHVIKRLMCICTFQAQKDAEILKSVVLPLEEEIAKLQKKVREQDDKVETLERQKTQVA